jgi:uncharacterized delta-60 repeat protein
VLDPSFGGDGIATANPGSFDQGRAVAIQADDMIVVAGYSDGDFVVLRYDDADGELDSTFGTAGIVKTNLGGSDYARSVAIQPADQKIIVGGTYGAGGYTFAAVRYLTNGTLDSTFDTDGIAIADIAGTSDEEPAAVAIQTDGKIVLAGHSHTATRFALARLNTNGSLDASFGASGVVVTAYQSSSMGRALAIQTDGRILIAGSSFDGVDETAAVVRYLSDGTLDPSFGIRTYGIPAEDHFGNAIALQDDGNILIAGYVNNNSGDYDIELLRVLP